jgi:hypothetical protein
MKTILKIYLTTNQARIFTALVLTGILSIGGNFTFINNATAAPANLMPESTTNQFIKQNIRTNNLPRRVANAVLRDVSRRSQISIKELEIVESTPRTWNNGCLGLSQPGEVCTQALVPGWKVVVSDGKQEWVYHTNSNGRLLRIASTHPAGNSEAKLPESLKNAVLQAASERLNVPISQLNIVQAKQQTWKDGCLELSPPDEACTTVLVEGWRVVVGTVDQTLVYHTNAFGSALRLNEKASEITDDSTVTPVTIPESELPPALNRNVVFRQISSGGLFARTYETVLLNDGRIIRYEKGDVNDPERQVWQVSPQQLKEFQQLLEKQKLSELRNLSYPANEGSADYLTYTITTKEGTIQYNDVSQNNLPQNLQIVVKAWNEIRDTAIANPSTDDKLKPLPIPVSELPPPLNNNVVFRQISSGGFMGKTYETILLRDGRLMQYQMGDTNDSQRRVWRLSRRKVRQFQKLLKEHRFSELENLSYPASKGSADYITYTITSDDTTVRYNDVSQDNIPKNLQAIVKAWNQIRKNYQ